MEHLVASNKVRSNAPDIEAEATISNDQLFLNVTNNVSVLLDKKWVRDKLSKLQEEENFQSTVSNCRKTEIKKAQKSIGTITVTCGLVEQKAADASALFIDAALRCMRGVCLQGTELQKFQDVLFSQLGVVTRMQQATLNHAKRLERKQEDQEKQAGKQNKKDQRPVLTPLAKTGISTAVRLALLMMKSILNTDPDLFSEVLAVLKDAASLAPLSIFQGPPLSKTIEQNLERVSTELLRMGVGATVAGRPELFSEALGLAFSLALAQGSANGVLKIVQLLLFPDQADGQAPPTTILLGGDFGESFKTSIDWLQSYTPGARLCWWIASKKTESGKDLALTGLEGQDEKQDEEYTAVAASKGKLYIRTPGVGIACVDVTSGHHGMVEAQNKELSAGVKAHMYLGAADDSKLFYSSQVNPADVTEVDANSLEVAGSWKVHRKGQKLALRAPDVDEEKEEEKKEESKEESKEGDWELESNQLPLVGDGKDLLVVEAVEGKEKDNHDIFVHHMVCPLAIAEAGLSDKDKEARLITSKRTKLVGINKNTGEVLKAVNCGGGQCYGKDGVVYEADHGFYSEAGFFEQAIKQGYDGNVIQSTADQQVYRMCRQNRSTFGYRFEVENGPVTVTLKFAEVVYGSPQDRFFNVSINGRPVLRNYDCVKRTGGQMKADQDLVFYVFVEDRTVDIKLEPLKGKNPFLSGLVIRKYEIGEAKDLELGENWTTKAKWLTNGQHLCAVFAGESVPKAFQTNENDKTTQEPVAMSFNLDTGGLEEVYFVPDDGKLPLCFDQTRNTVWAFTAGDHQLVSYSNKALPNLPSPPNGSAVAEPGVPLEHGQILANQPLIKDKTTVGDTPAVDAGLTLLALMDRLLEPHIMNLEHHQACPMISCNFGVELGPSGLKMLNALLEKALKLLYQAQPDAGDLNRNIGYVVRALLRMLRVQMAVQCAKDAEKTKDEKLATAHSKVVDAIKGHLLYIIHSPTPMNSALVAEEGLPICLKQDACLALTAGIKAFYPTIKDQAEVLSTTLKDNRRFDQAAKEGDPEAKAKAEIIRVLLNTLLNQFQMDSVVELVQVLVKATKKDDTDKKKPEEEGEKTSQWQDEEGVKEVFDLLNIMLIDLWDSFQGPLQELEEKSSKVDTLMLAVEELISKKTKLLLRIFLNLASNCTEKEDLEGSGPIGDLLKQFSLRCLSSGTTFIESVATAVDNYQDASAPALVKFLINSPVGKMMVPMISSLYLLPLGSGLSSSILDPAVKLLQVSMQMVKIFPKEDAFDETEGKLIHQGHALLDLLCKQVSCLAGYLVCVTTRASTVGSNEEENSHWLESKLLSGEIDDPKPCSLKSSSKEEDFDAMPPPGPMPSLFKTESHMKEEKDFIQQLVGNIDHGAMFMKKLSPKTPPSPFNKMGGEPVDKAIRYLVAAMLKHENISQAALAFTLTSLSDESVEVPEAVLEVWKEAWGSRKWFIDEKQRTGKSYQTLADEAILRCRLLLRFQARGKTVASPAPSLMKQLSMMGIKRDQSTHHKSKWDIVRNSLEAVSRLKHLMQERRLLMTSTQDVGDNEPPVKAVVKFFKSNVDVAQLEECIILRTKRAQARIDGLRAATSLLRIGCADLNMNEEHLGKSATLELVQLSHLNLTCLTQVLYWLTQVFTEQNNSNQYEVKHVLSNLAGSGFNDVRAVRIEFHRLQKYMCQLVAVSNPRTEVRQLALLALMAEYDADDLEFLQDNGVLTALHSQVSWNQQLEGMNLSSSEELLSLDGSYAFEDDKDENNSKPTEPTPDYADSCSDSCSDTSTDSEMQAEVEAELRQLDTELREAGEIVDERPSESSASQPTDSNATEEKEEQKKEKAETEEEKKEREAKAKKEKEQMLAKKNMAFVSRLGYGVLALTCPARKPQDDYDIESEFLTNTIKEVSQTLEGSPEYSENTGLNGDIVQLVGEKPLFLASGTRNALNGYVFPNAPSFDNDFTMTMWLYLETLPNEKSVIFRKGKQQNDSAQTAWLYADGKIEFSCGVLVETEKKIGKRKWVHLGFGRSDNTVSIYINGKLSGSKEIEDEEEENKESTENEQKSSEAPPASSWACPACTFANSFVDFCEMCNHERPGGASTASPEDVVVTVDGESKEGQEADKEEKKTDEEGEEKPKKKSKKKEKRPILTLGAEPLYLGSMNSLLPTGNLETEDGKTEIQQVDNAPSEGISNCHIKQMEYRAASPVDQELKQLCKEVPTIPINNEEYFRQQKYVKYLLGLLNVWYQQRLCAKNKHSMTNSSWPKIGKENVVPVLLDMLDQWPNKLSSPDTIHRTIRLLRVSLMALAGFSNKAPQATDDELKDIADRLLAKAANLLQIFGLKETTTSQALVPSDVGLGLATEVVMLLRSLGVNDKWGAAIYGQVSKALRPLVVMGSSSVESTCTELQLAKAALMIAGGHTDTLRPGCRVDVTKGESTGKGTYVDIHPKVNQVLVVMEGKTPLTIQVNDIEDLVPVTEGDVPFNPHALVLTKSTVEPFAALLANARKEEEIESTSLIGWDIQAAGLKSLVALLKNPENAKMCLTSGLLPMMASVAGRPAKLSGSFPNIKSLEVRSKNMESLFYDMRFPASVSLQSTKKLLSISSDTKEEVVYFKKDNGIQVDQPDDGTSVTYVNTVAVQIPEEKPKEQDEKADEKTSTPEDKKQEEGAVKDSTEESEKGSEDKEEKTSDDSSKEKEEIKLEFLKVTHPAWPKRAVENSKETKELDTYFTRSSRKGPLVGDCLVSYLNEDVVFSGKEKYKWEMELAKETLAADYTEFQVAELPENCILLVGVSRSEDGSKSSLTLSSSGQLTEDFKVSESKHTLEPFGSGDIIGVGRNYSRGEIFFTKNGIFLGPGFDDFKGLCYPCLWMHGKGIAVRPVPQSKFLFSDKDKLPSVEKSVDIVKEGTCLRGVYTPKEGPAGMLHMRVISVNKHEVSVSVYMPQIKRKVEMQGSLLLSSIVLKTSKVVSKGQESKAEIPENFRLECEKGSVEVTGTAFKQNSEETEDDITDIGKVELRIGDKLTALEFSPKKNSHVEFGNPSHLNFEGNFTAEVWVRLAKTEKMEGTQYIVSHFFGEDGIFLRVKDGKYEAGILAMGTTTVVSADIPAEDLQERWTCLSMTCDGAKWMLYRDGVHLASETSTQTAAQNSGPWVLGAKLSIEGSDRNFTDAFEGQIEEFRMWSVNLESDYIKDNYNAVVSGSERGIAGAWLLSEGIGSIVFDATKNGCNGNCSNTCWVDADNPKSNAYNPMLWDPEKMAPEFKLDGGNTIANYDSPGQNTWKTVCGQFPITPGTFATFTITLTKLNYPEILVGVCTKDRQYTTWFASQGGYGLYGYQSFYTNGSSRSYGKTSLKSGDVIEVQVDMSTSKMRYIVNEDDWGEIEVSTLGDKEVYPAVSLYYGGDICSIEGKFGAGEAGKFESVTQRYGTLVEELGYPEQATEGLLEGRSSMSDFRNGLHQMLSSFEIQQTKTDEGQEESKGDVEEKESKEEDGSKGEETTSKESSGDKKEEEKKEEDEEKEEEEDITGLPTPPSTTTASGLLEDNTALDNVISSTLGSSGGGGGSEKEEEAEEKQKRLSVLIGGHHWDKVAVAQMVHNYQTLLTAYARSGYLTLLSTVGDKSDVEKDEAVDQKKEELNVDGLGGADFLCRYLRTLAAEHVKDISVCGTTEDGSVLKTAERKLQMLLAADASFGELMLLESLSHLIRSSCELKKEKDPKKDKENKKDEKKHWAKALKDDSEVDKEPNVAFAFWLLRQLFMVGEVPTQQLDTVMRTLSYLMAKGSGDNSLIPALTMLVNGVRCMLALPSDNRPSLPPLLHLLWRQLRHMHQKKMTQQSYFSSLLELTLEMRMLEDKVTKEEADKTSKKDWFVDACVLKDMLQVFANKDEENSPSLSSEVIQNCLFELSSLKHEICIETPHPYVNTSKSEVVQVDGAKGYLIQIDEKTKLNDGEMVLITKDPEGKEFEECFSDELAGNSILLKDLEKMHIHYPVKMANKWDPEKKGIQHVISGMKVSHNENCYMYTITMCRMPIPSTGKYRFDVMVEEQGSEIYVGVCESTHNRETNLGNTQQGWGYSSNSYFYNSTCTSFGKSYTKGDTIGVEVDMDSGELTFFKNDESLGSPSSCTSLRGKTVFPAVCTYYRNSSFTLIVPPLEKLKLTSGATSNPRQHGVSLKIYPAKWTSEAKEKMKVEDADVENAKKLFEEFDKVADDNFIDMISNFFEAKQLDPLTAHPLQFQTTKREVDTFERLRKLDSVVKAGDDNDKLTAVLRLRFTVLQMFNQKLSTVFPLLDLAKAKFSEGLASQLMACRGYIFAAAKANWLRDAIKSTMSTKSFPYITVDRLTAIAKRDEPASDEALMLTVFGQCFKALDKECEALRQKERAWHVDYAGENSIDAGGPYREILTFIVEELEMKHVDLFVKCPNGKAGTGYNREKHVPTPVKNDTRLKMYRFIGKLAGIAIRSQNPIQVNWPSVIWKQLVRQPLSRSDISSIDEIFIKCNDDMIDIDKKGVTEEMFSENIEESFTTYNSVGTEVELVEGGRNIQVTFNNRHKYVQLQEEFRLGEFHDQCEAIRSGISTIVPIDLLELHTWKELELLVMGKPDVDVAMLKRHTKYQGHKMTDNVIRFFWEAMESYTALEKQRFLRFVWGRARLPLTDDGFAQQFIISNAYRDNDAALPESHTCFFQIDLPRYSSLEILTERLRYAFTNCISIDND